METRRIKLREVQEGDLPILFKWRNTEKFRFLFHHNENIIDYKGFCEEFTRDATVRKFQFVIEKINNKELIGLTFIHSFSEIDNCCFLNLFFKEEFERKGYGVDAFILFCIFLFESVKIKKIYTEAFAYNTYSIACIRKTGMVEIENLSMKKIHTGKEYPVLRFVADSTLLQKIKQFKRILCIQKPYNQ